MNIFMDKIDNASNHTEFKNFKNILGGQMTHEIVCKDCPHKSKRNQPFMSLSVEVNGKKSLEEALQKMIKGEMLEGENAYHCDWCSAK